MSKEELSINGGTPVITEGIPSGMHGPSVIDQREMDAATAVLKSGKLFRFCEDSHVAAFQEEAAKKMDISQPTLNRLLNSARKKAAEALVKGKAIRVEGGHYRMAGKGRGPRGGGRGSGPRWQR